MSLVNDAKSDLNVLLEERDEEQDEFEKYVFKQSMVAYNEMKGQKWITRSEMDAYIAERTERLCQS